MNRKERELPMPIKFNLERPASGGYRGPDIGDFLDFDRATTTFVNAIHDSKLLQVLLKNGNMKELLARGLVTKEDLRVQAFSPVVKHFGGRII